MEPVQSELYSKGGTIRTANVNKQNEAKAQQLDNMMAAKNAAEADMRASNRAMQAYKLGGEDVKMALAKKLADNPQYIVAGSPADVRMQEDMQRGYNNAVNAPVAGAGMAQRLRNMPGDIYDAVANKLGGLFAGDVSEKKAPVSSFAAQGNQMRDSMREDAYNTAWERARAMGNTSEDNMNALIIEEEKKRGL